MSYFEIKFTNPWNIQKEFSVTIKDSSSDKELTVLKDEQEIMLFSKENKRQNVNPSFNKMGNDNKVTLSLHFSFYLFFCFFLFFFTRLIHFSNFT